MEAFAEAGVTLITLSYDEPDALADFAVHNGITFPMLLHISVLYEPRLAAIFQLAPLAKDHWRTVAYFSAPLVLLEEMLKLWARCLGNEG